MKTEENSIHIERWKIFMSPLNSMAIQNPEERNELILLGTTESTRWITTEERNIKINNEREFEYLCDPSSGGGKQKIYISHLQNMTKLTSGLIQFPLKD